MASKRVLLWFVASATVFAVVAGVKWSEVDSVTLFDGSIHRDHLILGRFTYTSMTPDSRVRSTKLAASRLSAYGLPGFEPGGTGMIIQRRRTSEYNLWQQRKGDIRQEAALLTKKMPWLKVAWHGTRFTSFYAKGTHPSLGGVVSVSCARLPERKHGPNQIRVAASLLE